MNRNNNDTPKTIIEHIIELRSAILHSLIYMIIGLIISLLFYKNVLNFLIAPLKSVINGNKIIYTSITEPITTELRVSFYSGLILSFPFIVNKIWKFAKPGLYKNEILIIKKYSLLIAILFLIGVFFAYYFVIPNILEALIKINNENFVFLPKMSESVSFMVIIMLSFGLSFELPLLMRLLDRINILPFSRQKKMWREYVVIIIIISAIITPPDILSMLFLACPLILLYFLTLLYSYSLQKGKK